MEPQTSSITPFKIIISIVLACIAINLGFVNYLLYIQNTELPEPAKTPSATVQVGCDQSCKDTIKSEVAALAKTIPTTLPVVSSTPTAQKSQPASRPTIKPTVVAPRIFTVNIGAGQTASADWTDLPNLQTTVNVDQTGKINSAVFEVTLSIPQTKGIAYVRLFDVMENKTVPGSELTTTNGSPTTLTSQPFTIDRTKTFKVQMKSSETENAVLDQSKIKLTLN